MKIVRARLKKLEDIDPVFVCCEQVRKHVSAENNNPKNDCMIDLDSAQKITSFCKYCGKGTEITVVNIVSSYKRTYDGTECLHAFLESADIDEGPGEAYADSENDKL